MEHNYRLKINRLIAEGKIPNVPGTVNRVDVQHDDWCAVFNGGKLCNCNPDIRLDGKLLKPTGK